MNTTPARAAAQREAPPRPERAKAENGKRTIFYYDSGAELRVEPSGLKVWQCRVSVNGKRAVVAIGPLSKLNRKEAEAKAAALRAADNPIAIRREEKAQAVAGEASFRDLAARWVDVWSVSARWTPRVKAAVEARLRNYVLPAWGDRPIASIKMEDVEDLILPIHEKHPQTAVMVKQHVSGVLGYAVRRRLIAFDPVKQIAPDLPKRLKGDSKRNPIAKTIEEARAILRAVEAPRPRKHAISVWTLLAHRLISLTGCRKDEVLGATWEEFSPDATVWTIPADRTKTQEEHIVFLSPQATEVIETANAIRRNGFVFAASQRSERKGERIDRSSLNVIMARALRRAGLTRADKKTGEQKPVMSPHGWRGTFSTIMNNKNAADHRVIEVMIGHKIGERGSSEWHYNRSQHEDAQRRIAAQWANMLLEGNPTSAFALAGLDSATASNVVPLRRAAA